MIINGDKLLSAAPIVDMVTDKRKYMGSSYGLGEAGYDIRIKQDVVFTFDIRGAPVTIVFDHDTDIKKTLKGHFILASSIDKFNVPKNLVGEVKDKSTWARRGLSVFNTVIEPGWAGWLTLELVYHGQENLHIYSGQGIAQVLFSELAEIGDYGTGKYQNATNNPQEAI
jgi:dCTP deaminase